MMRERESFTWPMDALKRGMGTKLPEIQKEGESKEALWASPFLYRFHWWGVFFRYPKSS
jgi:hypothetical protein